MKNRGCHLSSLRKENGVTIVLVAICLFVLIAMVALGVDIFHLVVTKNELQNAADAGALAGARFLYNANGTSINADCNNIALTAATSNLSEKIAVEVWPGEVERGHWSFTAGAFTPNDSLAPTELWNVSWATLDANPNFINAVRVRARREEQSIASWFARIFGYTEFTQSAVAVAYIGFAGKVGPGEFDQPLGICKQAITDPNTGVYTCGVGRMINSGSNEGHQTGGWTNFTQEPCSTASANTVRPLVCASGNPGSVILGAGMGTTGGEVQTAYDKLMDCWSKNSSLDTDGDKIPDKFWNMTLPVIECPGNNTGICAAVVGAVNMNVIWITRTDKNQMKEVPRKMENWTCPAGYTGPQCWNSFVEHFRLKDVLNQTPAIYEDKTIYYLPDCTPHELKGNTGGENFGVLARIPVLVN
jgi:hypothetical protein